jgi:lipopolysaccharide export system protein LptA
MASPVSRLRWWFALGAILMVTTVAGMYFYARLSLRKAVREVPAKLGLDIQQTADGFSISKSIEGRTQFTVSASKAVQFKEGGARRTCITSKSSSTARMPAASTRLAGMISNSIPHRAM